MTHCVKCRHEIVVGESIHYVLDVADLMGFTAPARYFIYPLKGFVFRGPDKADEMKASGYLHTKCHVNVFYSSVFNYGSWTDDDLRFDPVSAHELTEIIKDHDE